MKAKLAIVMSVFLLMYGCIEEDTSMCYDDGNAMLDFVLYDSGGQEVFARHVDRVDMFIFDSRGRFYSYRELQKQDLEKYQGVKLDLPPGTYEIVCWGNVADKSDFAVIGTQAATKEEFYLYYEDKNDGDPVYYGPKGAVHADDGSQSFMVTIPQNGKYSGTLEFSPVHRRIHVWIEGYRERSGIGDLLPPHVELQDMPVAHDFSVGDLSHGLTYRHKTGDVVVDGIRMDYAMITTGLFDHDTPSKLRIVSNDGRTVVDEFMMDEIIRDLKVNLYDHFDRNIYIHIKYLETGVYILLPSWLTQEIKPGV